MPITTIPFSARKAGPYMATAGQTEFSFGFPVFAAGDLTVWRERAGVVTQLLLTTHYTVAGIREQGGGQVMLTAGALEGDIIAIDGTLDPERATSFIGGTPFKTVHIDSDLNRLAIMVQELAREVSRSVRRAAIDEQSGSLMLPIDVTETLFLAINAAGEIVGVVPLSIGAAAVSPFMAQLFDDPDAAAARATLGVRRVLTEDEIIFVDVVTGDDDDDGLTLGTALQTQQEAWNRICTTLNLNGYDVVIQLADGTHAGLTDYSQDGFPGTQSYIGGGRVIINGNASNPQNVIIDSAGYSIHIVNSYIEIRNCEVRATAGLGGIGVAWRGVLETGPGIRLGASAGERVHASSGGQVRDISGAITMVGNAAIGVGAYQGGQVRLKDTVITHVGTPAYAEAFACVSAGGVADLRGATFPGAATGKAFIAEPGGQILRDTNNLFDLPGNAEGELGAGALYDEIVGPIPAEIASGSFSGATVVVPIPVWAKRLSIHVEGVSSNTASRFPIILASTDGGITYPTTDYNCFGLSAVPALQVGDALVSMFTAVAAARSWDYDAWIEGIGGGGVHAHWQGVTDDSSAGVASGQSFNAALDGRITHIRFGLNSSGNHDAGIYSVTASG